MKHIYEIDSDRGIYWEVWDQITGEPWADRFLQTLETKEQFDLYLDILREIGVDFVVHTLAEYDEYHLAI